MKKIISSIVLLLSVLSCTNLAINSLDILGNNLVQDKGEFLKSLVSTYRLIDTVDAKYGYTLDSYKYKNALFHNYKKKESKNALIYVHGGAFVITDILSNYYTMMEDMLEKSQKNYEILMLDVKGDKYPSQSQELDDLLEYALKKYDKIVIMGDSSGGNVILSNILKRRDEKKILPNGIVLLSAWADLTNTVPSRIDRFESDILIGKKTTKLLNDNPYIKDVKDRKNPYVSPVFASFHKFPKTLLQVGSREVLFDDTRLIYENMIRMGVDAKMEIYPDMIHVFQLFNFFDETPRARANIVKFMESIYD